MGSGESPNPVGNGVGRKTPGVGASVLLVPASADTARRRMDAVNFMVFC